MLYIYVVTKRRLTEFSAELRPAKFFGLYSGREIFDYFIIFSWFPFICRTFLQQLYSAVYPYAEIIVMMSIVIVAWLPFCCHVVNYSFSPVLTVVGEAH